MLNAAFIVKSVLADVSSVSPSSEQARSLCYDEGITLETSANTLFMAFKALIHCTFYRHADADQN